jgi:Uma2 family endonuclease
MKAAPAEADPLKRLPTDLDLELDPERALASLPTDRDLPCSDGVPMETPWHRAAMNQLIETLKQHWRGRADYFVGGDMFLYFSTEHVFNKDFRGPDFFVVRGVDHDKPRRSWIVWQEGGRFPDVIIELASESTIAVDRGAKKKLYAETFRTAEYYIYDPDRGQLEGWHLAGNRYAAPVALTANGRAWSHVLGLFVGPWDGEFQQERDRWPRFFDADGSLILTFAEIAAIETNRADAEKARADNAEAEAARLRAELAALKPPPTP